jgi:hypothetical protein
MHASGCRPIMDGGAMTQLEELEAKIDRLYIEYHQAREWAEEIRARIAQIDVVIDRIREELAGGKAED